MAKVTVVGAGFVGSTTALRILQRGLADVCLIDLVEGLPQGLALDLNQSAPIERFEVTCVGTNDYKDTAGWGWRGSSTRPGWPRSSPQSSRCRRCRSRR